MRNADEDNRRANSLDERKQHSAPPPLCSTTCPNVASPYSICDAAVFAQAAQTHLALLDAHTRIHWAPVPALYQREIDANEGEDANQGEDAKQAEDEN